MKYLLIQFVQPSLPQLISPGGKNKAMQRFTRDSALTFDTVLSYEPSKIDSSMPPNKGTPNTLILDVCLSTVLKYNQFNKPCIDSVVIYSSLRWVNRMNSVLE